tara:strand:- start:363 stop:1229 length:867 start_codon:yes stop_codon:yes gene_type:complete
MLGTGTVNLPNTHPLAVASSITMLDHLSNGRIILGIGPGSLISDMEAFGTLAKNRNEMFLESIRQILKIWNSKPPYKIKGKYWNITTKKTFDKKISIGVFNKPLQKPHPEIVCTSLSRNLYSIKSLSQRGWNLISSNFLQAESLKFHYQGILDGNKKKSLKNWRVARKIFVNPNKKIVDNYVYSKNGPYYMTLVQIMKKLKKYNKLDILKKNPDDQKENLHPEKLLKDLVICGDADTVAEKVLNLRNKVGNFDTLTYVGIDWQNPRLAKKSIELFGTKVIEKINKNLK